MPPPVPASLLAGRRALVTGAAGGVGGGVVEAFRAAGAEVVGADLLPTEGLLRCDVTDEATVEACFAQAGHVDDIVHAAGVVALGEVASLSLDEFRRVLEVNLVGSFLVARAAARTLGRGGTLTLVASQAGRHGGAGWSAYCASKFGVIGLVECLAQELAPHGVRVNAVCPGTVETTMTETAIAGLAAGRGATPGAVRDRYLAGIPLGRFAEPREIGLACVFLASQLASYVAGASLVLDGGELS
jgi:NAD(P)-dependent dehydrogenase (short-subunit alcohol dehydrogenase family)